MFTRAILDELLPEQPETIALARSLSGIDPSQLFMCSALRWMADFTEADRFFMFGPERPAWAKPGATLLPISMGGLSYKEASTYLTTEGWPSGEPCWYVRVECGYRWFIGAIEPEYAVARALIIMSFTKRVREVQQPDFDAVCVAIEKYRGRA